MNINRHNYEAYLLDQLEGRLSVDEQKELKNFLLLNPDCVEELSEIDPFILNQEKVSYKNSNRLLKKEWPDTSAEITVDNFDLHSIARMEGDLNAEQLEAHQSMLEADARKAKQWDQWQRTRLIPEELKYPGKEGLKRAKSSGRRTIWLSIISAAAAVGLLLVLLRTGPELPEQKVYIQDLPSPGSEQAAGASTNTEMETSEPAQTGMEPSEPAQTGLETSEPARMEIKTSEPALREMSSSVHDRSAGELAGEVRSPDDLQPAVIAFSSIQPATSSMLKESVPDKIEPLHIPPVPVHISSLTVAQLSDLDLQEMVEEYAEESGLSFWTIAGAGIRGINKLAGSEISLLASTDEEGEVDGFHLKSKRFSFSRPLGREE